MSESADRRKKDVPYERELARARLAVSVTEALWEELERAGLRQADLADRLDVSRPHISQALGSGRNLTLRTLADIAWALDCRARVTLLPARFDESFVTSTGLLGPTPATTTFSSGEVELPALPPAGTSYAHAA